MSLSSYEPVKKIITDLKGMKCSRKGCLSDQRDTLEIAWFGNQYENKEMTCSSCYLLDNEAIKKSLPSNLNVLPLIHFTDKFMEEFKKYQEKKNTAAFSPKIVKEKQTQLDAQNNKTQIRVFDVLKGLEMALQTFTKKISAQNKNIFTNKIFQEIITMNNENKFEGLLQKILLLIQGLNFSDLSNAYEFENLQSRQKKVKKLRQKIRQVQERTIKVLTSLYEDLKTKNETISKI